MWISFTLPLCYVMKKGSKQQILLVVLA